MAYIGKLVKWTTFVFNSESMYNFSIMPIHPKGGEGGLTAE